MLLRRTLYVCDGQCEVATCKILARTAVELLGLNFGETTRDGRLKLSTLRCRECQGSASIVMIDDDVYEIRGPSDLCDLISGIQEVGSCPNVPPPGRTVASSS